MHALDWFSVRILRGAIPPIECVTLCGDRYRCGVTGPLFPDGQTK